VLASVRETNEPAREWGGHSCPGKVWDVQVPHPAVQQLCAASVSSYSNVFQELIPGAQLQHYQVAALVLFNQVRVSTLRQWVLSCLGYAVVPTDAEVWCLQLTSLVARPRLVCHVGGCRGLNLASKAWAWFGVLYQHPEPSLRLCV
jgi:hypothetical protein